MALLEHAIIDRTYFEQMWTGADVDIDRLENFINSVSASFEKFCNRKLKERTYTYDEEEVDSSAGIYYVPEYTIFDAPRNEIFWFPTYPVSSISHFEISGIEITAATATDYTGDDGYILYKKTGKLIYMDRFDYPYMQNVRMKWTGGYADDSAEMYDLKHLCFLTIKDLLNAPQNMTYESERIGQYQYKTVSTFYMKQLQGLSPKVFSELVTYRREVIT